MNPIPERSAHVEWLEGLRCLLERQGRYFSMWQAVHVRLLGWALEGSTDEWVTHGAHFQLSPRKLVPTSRQRMDAPLLLEGVITIRRGVNAPPRLRSHKRVTAP